MKDFLKKIIPAKYHFLASEFKNLFFGGYDSVYYSQFGEDAILKSIFKNINKGFYVDVGAHHPKRYSNTYLLFKKGWRGINIDPNPYAIKLFNFFRRKDINLRAGVSADNRELTYYLFSDPAINTFSVEKANKFMGKSWVEFLKSENMKTLTLKDILTEHLPKGTKIDLLNVDAEGFDLEVLRSSDWSLFCPKVIVVEDENFNSESPKDSEVYTFLKEKSYRLHAFTGISLIFIRLI